MSATSVPAKRPRLSVDDWIQAGFGLLTSDGIDAVKIDSVAARLGVTKGSFYWHFKNLAAFQEAMVARFIADQQEMMESFEQIEPAEPRARLLSMMNRVSEVEIGELEHAMRGWAYTGAQLMAHFQRIDSWAFGVVRDAFEGLGFSRYDAEVRAKALYYAGVGRVHVGTLGEAETLEHREALLGILTRC